MRGVTDEMSGCGLCFDQLCCVGERSELSYSCFVQMIW